MPDAVPLVRTVLLDDPSVAELIDDRVHFRVPATKVFPFVRLWVVPGGGITVEDRVSRTVFDVHCYGDPDGSEVDHHLLARTVHAALIGASLQTDDAVLLDVTEVVAPYPLPDDSVGRDEPLPRWLSTVAAHVRPNP